MNNIPNLFDQLVFKDPVSHLVLEKIVLVRTPAGVPICGALRVPGTATGYPIVDCIARLTPELSNKYSDWLKLTNLEPVKISGTNGYQDTQSVDSFGWQWTWNSNMRTDEDLRMRVVEKFAIKPDFYLNRIVADMGAGAGDQSAYMLKLGSSVVSVDLSSAIEVVSKKLRMNSRWFGVQGDITHLPFQSEQFDVVYCEGVIQHTQDSGITIRELCRVTKKGGSVLAAHYIQLPAKTRFHKIKRKVIGSYYSFLRIKLSRLEKFKLLFVTGLFTALSYIPGVGYCLRKTGTVLYYKLMPDFKTTWTNTYDFYGSHEHQRFVEPEKFYNYFNEVIDMKCIYSRDGNVNFIKN